MNRFSVTLNGREQSIMGCEALIMLAYWNGAGKRLLTSSSELCFRYNWDIKSFDMRYHLA